MMKLTGSDDEQARLEWKGEGRRRRGKNREGKLISAQQPGGRTGRSGTARTAWTVQACGLARLARLGRQHKTKAVRRR